MKEATFMASRIKIRLILELNASGMSQNDIARTGHMSRSSISTVMRIAKEKNISKRSNPCTLTFKRPLTTVFLFSDIFWQLW